MRRGSTLKRFYLLAVGAAALAMVVASPAQAQRSPQRSASGDVSMTVHTHSNGVLMFPTERLPFNFTVGDTFAYSSRICSGNAPFNDIGLNFTPNYPGVDEGPRSAARVRHWAQGTIVQAAGNRGVVHGTITTALCVRDASGAWVPSQHVIVSRYVARYELRSPNDLHLNGVFRFSPSESSGTFRDLQGGGRFEARLTCLGATSCAPAGEFHDFVSSTGNPSLPAGQLQPGMNGSFYDPTVRPIGAPTV